MLEISERFVSKSSQIQSSLLNTPISTLLRTSSNNVWSANMCIKSGFAQNSLIFNILLKNPLKLRYFNLSLHFTRPCFIPDRPFKSSLQRYPGKEEISAPKSQHSIYQQGFGMMFCNPGPIAASW